MERQLFKEKFEAQSSTWEISDLEFEVCRLMNTDSVFAGKGTLNLIGCIEECSELITILSLLAIPRLSLIEEVADVIITSSVVESFANISPSKTRVVRPHNYCLDRAICDLSICQQDITRVLRGRKEKEDLKITVDRMRTATDWICHNYNLTEEGINKAINVKLELFKTMEVFK